MDQSEFEANTWQPVSSAGSSTNFVNQSQSVVKQNQSKREITFDTQLKTALTHLKSH